MAEVEGFILKELSKLKTENVPKEELSKGKDMILGDIYRGVDDAESCGEIISNMEIQFGNENALTNYVNKMKAVTTEELREVANRYLQEENLAMAVLTPKT